jgi:hypothetical protein
MNISLSLFLSLLLFATISCTEHSKVHTTDDKTELLSLEHSWLEAEFKLDTTYLSSIIDETFLDISENGVHDKQEAILSMYNNINQRIKDSIIVDSFKLESSIVNLYDNTAVVIFIVHTYGKNKEVITERKTRFYDVWVKRKDRWKAAASQGSKVD